MARYHGKFEEELTGENNIEGWEGEEYFGGIGLTIHHSSENWTLRELRIMDGTGTNFL